MASSLTEIESRSDMGAEEEEDQEEEEEEEEEFDSDYEYASDDSSYDYGCPSELMEQQRSLFNQEPVPCAVCLEDRIEEGCAIVLPSCRHSFCVECFSLYVEAQIGEGNADSIACPFVHDAAGGGDLIGRRCGAAVGEDVLREIMTQERYDRLLRQKESAFVRKNADYHHCPTPDCDNVVLCKFVDDGDGARGGTAGARICDCFKCGQTSCLTCGARPFHFRKTCEEHREEERLRAERLRAERLRAEQLRVRELHRMQLVGGGYAQPGVDRSRAGEEARYDFDIGGDAAASVPGVGGALENVRRCRRCGNGVELAYGCLKMKCLCGYRFCFRCGAENAQCDCTPAHHGFSDNVTGRGDFSGLMDAKSYT